jgi:hypothetical protein
MSNGKLESVKEIVTRIAAEGAGVDAPEAEKGSDPRGNLPDAPQSLPCHICGKPKGQPPDRCPGHYDGTPSDPKNFLSFQLPDGWNQWSATASSLNCSRPARCRSTKCAAPKGWKIFSRSKTASYWYLRVLRPPPRWRILAKCRSIRRSSQMGKSPGGLEFRGGCSSKPASRPASWRTCGGCSGSQKRGAGAQKENEHERIRRTTWTARNGRQEDRQP